MQNIETPVETIESMEKLHNGAIGRSFTEDEAEDFRSYALTALAQLCAIIDELRGIEIPEK